MSERRPLLSSSPRQSYENLSELAATTTEWSTTNTSGFVDGGIHSIPHHTITKKVTFSPMMDKFPRLVNDVVKTNGGIKIPHRCGTSIFNEQDRRVWISADDPESFCGERHRTLVLCFDGTGDQFDDDNSNIVQFLAMLRKDDNAQQLVYYQAGLGTYTDFRTPIASAVSLALDQMIAWNLGSHVKDGYAFLMQNYTLGDRICIFGFSRGAYTARALAGMLQKVGLLPVCNHQQLPFAYDMYKREDKEGLDMSHAFKMTYSRSVNVDFLGVWDTVASVGFIPRFLPFIYENAGIRHLRHALALDEHRVKFVPQFCGGSKPEEREEHHHLFNFIRKPHREQSLKNSYKKLINFGSTQKTDAEEVWFAGVHCDVGGGATKNWIENKLARIPLRWMIRECFNCNTGILFDARMLQKIGLPVHKNADGHPQLAPLYDWTPGPAPVRPQQQIVPRVWWKVLLAALWCPFAIPLVSFRCDRQIPLASFRDDQQISLPFDTGADPVDTDSNADFEYDLDDIPDDYEYKHDLADCKTELNDEFPKSMFWVIMDWIPQRVKKQKAIINTLESGDSYKWLWNRGRGRKIPKNEIEEGLKVHRTVKMRLEELGEEYAPQARPNIRIARQDEHGRELKEPRRMTHWEWNNPNPEQWAWVGDH